MDFGPHSSFVPNSPLSYSTSYSPASPLKDQQQNKYADDEGNTNNDPVPLASNKSILKNPTTAYFKEQQRLKNNNLTESAKKSLSANLAPTRRETLKTVAFGLTTRLEDTVLAKEAKQSTTGTNRLNKTVIFSHEAQSLHKLLVEQHEEIVQLRKAVSELIAADDRNRAEAREQMNIIADLSSRLMDVERRMASNANREQHNSAENENTGRNCDENDKEKERMNTGNENVPPPAEKARDNNSSSKQSIARKSLFKQQQNNINEQNGKDCLQIQQRHHQLSPIPNNEGTFPSFGGHRHEILQRLDQQMQRNPYFENRIKSMLRVWSDDVSSPAIEQNRDESIGGGGPSMLLRVTTQRQELFYSSSPGRNRRTQQQQAMFPKGQDDIQPRRSRHRHSKPIVTEITDEDHEQFETVPNVRRSDHCTDDAEFFQQNNDSYCDENVNGHGQMEDGCYAMDDNAHNRTNNQQQHQHRRRRREATSAIRNKYKQ